MRVFPYYLYHICRAEDKYNLAKGYIGVSGRPKKRWASGGYKDNPHLMNALKKYDDIIKYVVMVGTKKECLVAERKLRPKKNMAWNIARGGGVPPSSKGLPHCIGNLPKDKRRKNYKHSEETKKKMSAAQRKRSKEISDQNSGEKNGMFGVHGRDHPGWTGWYITPLACFDSEEGVSKFYNISRPAVMRRCKIGGIIKPSRWTPKELFGKTWEEVGWSFREKEN